MKKEKTEKKEKSKKVTSADLFRLLGLGKNDGRDKDALLARLPPPDKEETRGSGKLAYWEIDKIANTLRSMVFGGNVDAEQALREAKLEQEVRIKRAGAEQAEIALKKTKGLVVDGNSVERVVADVAAEIRVGMVSIPASVALSYAAMSDAREIEGDLTRRIDDVLACLGRMTLAEMVKDERETEAEEADEEEGKGGDDESEKDAED